MKPKILEIPFPIPIKDKDLSVTILDSHILCLFFLVFFSSLYQPEGWIDDAPEYVADPEASQPEDWDVEEDGEWEAPMVPNPQVYRDHIHMYDSVLKKNQIINADSHDIGKRMIK